MYQFGIKKFCEDVADEIKDVHFPLLIGEREKMYNAGRNHSRCIITDLP